MVIRCNRRGSNTLGAYPVLVLGVYDAFKRHSFVGDFRVILRQISQGLPRRKLFDTTSILQHVQPVNVQNDKKLALFDINVLMVKADET